MHAFYTDTGFGGRYK